MPIYFVEILAIIISVATSYALFKASSNKQKIIDAQEVAKWQEKVDGQIQRIFEKIREAKPDTEKIRSVAPVISEVKETLEDIMNSTSNISVMVGKHGVRLDQIEEKIKDLKSDSTEKFGDVKNTIKELKDDIKVLNKEKK